MNVTFLQKNAGKIIGAVAALVLLFLMVKFIFGHIVGVVIVTIIVAVGLVAYKQISRSSTW